MRKIIYFLIIMVGVPWQSYGMLKVTKLFPGIAKSHVKNVAYLFQQKRFASFDNQKGNKKEGEKLYIKDLRANALREQAVDGTLKLKSKKTYFSKKTGAVGALVAMGLATILWLSNQDEETQLKFWRYFHSCVQKIPWALSKSCGVIAALSAAPLMLLAADGLLELGIVVVLFEHLAPMFCSYGALLLVAVLGWYCGEQWYEYHNRKITDINNKLLCVVKEKKIV